MKRVLTGYRPTGRLHLGHYHGNIEHMLKLQNEYECFFFIADWHALTTDYENPEHVAEYTREMIIDWLAAGIDPKKAAIYRQSDLPEVAELALYFGMITPLGWLERNPTYKEQLRELKERHLKTYGFLGYPVLQAADILIVKGEIVPVGEDQLPHLELTREIARRFNFLYGEYFKEPQALLSETPRVPGVDGRKMSKSYGNAIFLSDPPKVIREKISVMFTDPRRIYLKDPGHPEECPVFALHKLYSPQRFTEIEKLCKNAEIGCTDCKKELGERVVEFLEPFQRRREEILSKENIVSEVLKAGLEKVKPVALEVISDVHKLMGLKKI